MGDDNHGNYGYVYYCPDCKKCFSEKFYNKLKKNNKELL
jgi:hypothetical protein